MLLLKLLVLAAGGHGEGPNITRNIILFQQHILLKQPLVLRMDYFQEGKSCMLIFYQEACQRTSGHRESRYTATQEIWRCTVGSLFHSIFGRQRTKPRKKTNKISVQQVRCNKGTVAGLFLVLRRKIFCKNFKSNAPTDGPQTQHSFSKQCYLPYSSVTMNMLLQQRFKEAVSPQGTKKGRVVVELQPEIHIKLFRSHLLSERPPVVLYSRLLEVTQNQSLSRGLCSILPTLS